MAEQTEHATDLADETNGTSVSTASVPPDVQPVASDGSETEGSATAESAHAAAEPATDRDVTNDDLLGELARAMHAAATSQYERMNAELERRRAEQVEVIAARASAQAEALKAGSETDIGAIDAWAKAETEKIKQERLRRIDARREQLAAQLEREEAVRQREIFAIEVAIDGHRAEIDQFFGRMERETDPAAIARVASSLPPFPSLAEIAEEARRGATAEFASLDEEAGASSAPADAGPRSVDVEPAITEARLMAVMDPEATRESDRGATPAWEAPYAVSVAAGSGAAEPAVTAETHGRVGSTLLRTVRSIRPMAGSDKDDAQR